MSTTFAFECDIIFERDASIKVVIVETGEEMWFPMSTVHEIHRTKPHATIIVDDWIARKKGLA